MKTLNIIGAGRVGRSLAHLWHARGVFEIQDVLTTSAASAAEAVQFIGAGCAVPRLENMRDADVWMLAVPDGRINSMANEISNAYLAGIFVNSSAIVFHCSGALSCAEMQTLRNNKLQLASAHCLLSFSAPSSAITQFAGTLCALEGDSQSTAALKLAFEAIGANCFDLAAKNKLLYHAAAVFSTNFLPVLHVVAADLWRSSGMPASMIAPLNASLLQKAVQNIAAQGAEKALTGPAARGDTALVALQARAVADWQADAGQAYAALSVLAAKIAKSGTIKD